MSPKAILITVGTALVAFGEALQNTVEDSPETTGTQAPAAGGEAPAAGGEAPAAGGEAPKRRGRPPGGGTPAAATAGDTSTGPTDAERFEKNRALIKPLIDAAQGEDVKKVISKYSKSGLKDLPAESQAAFETDIAALTY